MVTDTAAETVAIQRIDKWLNISCLFKTRAQATKACEERRIKVNNDVTKPSRLIKSGDKVTVKTSGGKFFNVTILAISHKNVSVKDARLMYEREEPEMSDEAKELLALFSKSVKVHKAKYKGRPTKRDRRKMEQIKQELQPANQIE
jgi:ribosome-associated heat shock protein Hsp15